MRTCDEQVPAPAPPPGKAGAVATPTGTSTLARAVRFVERDAPFGERERLLVMVLEQHHVRLVAANRRHHVVGVHQRCKTFGLAQRAHRFVVASELGVRDARQRMHEREVAPIARRVQRGRGLCDVLAHDRHVADLAVALAELVVREPDAARVVCDLRLFQGTAVQGDGAGLIAARGSEPSVQAPQGGESPRRDGVAEGIGRASQRRRCLIEIVLEQRRFGEHRAERELVLPRQRRRSQRGREHLRSCGTAAAFERGAGADQQRLQ